MRLRFGWLVVAVLAVGAAGLAVAWWRGHVRQPGELSGGPTKMPQLHGLTVDAVLTELRQPARDCESAIGDDVAWVEFRIELHNFYPPSDPQSATVRIRECQWDYGGRHLAVWFHRVDDRWVVLDTCQWPEGVEF
jgi:hypothetical protein